MTQWETFGAALAVAASVVSNLGVNIQKYSHAQEARIVPASVQRPYVQRPLWWLGLALVVLGSLGDFTAFGFATQSLVAALGGGATLVSNVFIAYFLNKEALYAVRCMRCMRKGDAFTRAITRAQTAVHAHALACPYCLVCVCTHCQTDLGGVFFVIVGVVVIAWIAEPNAEYPLPELEKRFLRTGASIVCALTSSIGRQTN